VTLPLSSGLIVAALIFLDAAALLHPCDARMRGKPFSTSIVTAGSV
jgi:hypothetical protein